MMGLSPTVSKRHFKKPEIFPSALLQVSRSRFPPLQVTVTRILLTLLPVSLSANRSLQLNAKAQDSLDLSSRQKDVLLSTCAHQPPSVPALSAEPSGPLLIHRLPIHNHNLSFLLSTKPRFVSVTCGT